MRLTLSTPDKHGRVATVNLTKSPWASEGLRFYIVANPGGGKSYFMAYLAESAHGLQLPFIFYDVNGDAVSLNELGDDVLVVGNPQHSDPIRRADYHIGQALNAPTDYFRLALVEGFSLVFDLSIFDDDFSRVNAFTILAKAHYELAKRLRSSSFVFIDEAHNFAPQNAWCDGQSESLAVFNSLANDGRKKGMALIYATQRATFLNKSVLFNANLRAFGKITYDDDFDRIKSYIPSPHRKDGFDVMQKFRQGQFFLASPTMFSPEPIQTPARRTTDLGGTPTFIKPNRPRPSKASLQLPLFDTRQPRA